jgi:uncharacterized cysteine cluster protein YcgN (CxxCxxCC family)
LRGGYPILGLWGRRNRYSRHALIVMEALELYEASLCKGCGHSGLITYDKHENTHLFQPNSVVCVACEHLEALAQNENKADEWPGTKTFVENTMSADGGNDDGQASSDHHQR